MNKIIPVAIAAALFLGGCTPTEEGQTTLVLLTHDSFALSEGTLEQFTEQTGIEVEVQAAGDAGELVNKLVLTKDSPLGDVIYGIDNTFASRAANNGVLEEYVSKDVTDAEAEFLLPEGSGGGYLTPIDFGDVCVNVDHEWFAAAGIPEPTGFEDLSDEKYANLLVVESPATSSTGLAFLLATIAYGEESGGNHEGWQQYWEVLVRNGVKIDASWSDAYYVDFSGPSSEGDRPLVVSYASSPLFEPEGTTGALLDTCFRQIEYAGVVAGTKHSKEAQQLVDFLFSPTVQNDIPENMYVYPANSKATLSESWQAYPMPTNPLYVDPVDIDADRDEWLRVWAAITAAQ